MPYTYWLKKEKEKVEIGLFQQGEYKHKGCGGCDTQPSVGGGGRQRGTIQVGTLRRCVATNKICFNVSVYNVPDNLYDRSKKM